MSFSPIIPMGGPAGWAFLTRTLHNQKQAFAASAVNERETSYFETKISQITSAEELVRDRTLLKVALGAFGLEEDINNKFLIKKVLEDGTLNPDALANKFSDKRYFEFSKAFGFGDFDVPRTKLSEFATEILTAYQEKSFEAAIGEQNPSMRLALTLEGDIQDIAGKKSSEQTKWLSILGNPPLKEIFETALNLPKSFSNIAIDKQVEILRDKSRSRLGIESFDDFKNSEHTDKLRRQFLVMTQINGNSTQAISSPALTLLRSM